MANCIGSRYEFPRYNIIEETFGKGLATRAATNLLRPIENHVLQKVQRSGVPCPGLDLSPSAETRALDKAGGSEASPAGNPR